jgi:hypothetical protein
VIIKGKSSLKSIYTLFDRGDTLLKFIKRELNTYNYKIWVLVFALFIIGELLSSVIVIVAKADDYASMGMLFSAYFGGMILFLLIINKFMYGFELAVKMSVSRQNYIIGAIGATFIVYICFFLVVDLFYYLDKQYVAFFFDNMPYELDFVNKMNICGILLISLLAVSISVLVGGLLEHFGKNLYSVVLVSGFIGIFIHRLLANAKALSAIEDQKVSNLFYKMLLSIDRVFETIPLFKLISVLIICALCLSIGISILRKQAVAN